MSAPLIGYAIHFYDYKVINIDGDLTDFKSVVLVNEVAKNLKVTPEQIIEAFQHWAGKGYPQSHFMVTGRGEKVKGGFYDIGIHVWNYQGQNSGVTEGPNMMGVISKVRVWGKGYQQIDSGRESFYLGPLA